MSAVAYDRPRGRIPGKPRLGYVKQADGSIHYTFTTKKRGETRQETWKVDEAEAFRLYDVAVGKDADGEIVVAKGSITLADVISLHLTQTEAKVGKTRTDGTYVKEELHCRRYIEPFFRGTTRFASIGEEDIEDFLQYLRFDKELSHWYVHKILQTVKNLYKVALRKQWINRNPVPLVDKDWVPPREPLREATIVTPSGFARMIAHVNPLYLNALIVLACTGLRISELCGLRWEFVDLELKRLYVEEQLAYRRVKDENGFVLRRGDGKAVRERYQDQPKGARGRGRTRSRRPVRLLPLALAALERQLFIEQQKGFGRPQDFVFTTSDGFRKAGLKAASGIFSGKAFDQHSLRTRGVTAAGKLAGLGHVLPHDLRHTTASMLHKAGISDATAARMLGHTTTQYRDTYVHVVDLDAEFEALDAALTGLGFGVDLNATVEEIEDEEVAA